MSDKNFNIANESAAWPARLRARRQQAHRGPPARATLWISNCWYIYRPTDGWWM